MFEQIMLFVAHVIKDGTGCTLLENAGAYSPEQPLIKYAP